MYIGRPAMLSHFHFCKPGLKQGFGLWAATSLWAVSVCCVKGGDGAAPAAGVPVASIRAAPGGAADLALEEHMEMMAAMKRAQEAGARLRKHREGLLATNEVMAAVWKEGLGKDAAAVAARAKITAFFHADAEGMALEEAFNAEMKAMREVQEKTMQMAQKKTEPSKQTGDIAPDGETAPESGAAPGEKLRPLVMPPGGPEGRHLNNGLRASQNRGLLIRK